MLTPFEQTIPEAERDPRLLEALKREGSGVLNWMLAGLREYQRNGLQVPEKIKGATAAYRDEQDIIGEWVAERCKSVLDAPKRRAFSTRTTKTGPLRTATSPWRRGD